MKLVSTKILYENKLDSNETVADFRMEGDGAVSFPQGRMRLESTRDADEGQKANLVFWCPEDFPDNISIEWDFWPIREPGLCIMFFGAKGRNGEDLFDPNLQPRTGEYNLYHSGDINAYHVSYFRRRWAQERAFHTANLRKSYGFHLVAQGADPIPSVLDAEAPYHIRINQYSGRIQFFINDLLIFDWQDDGEEYGPVLGGGKIGFRQMAPLIGEYANLKVSVLEVKDA